MDLEGVKLTAIKTEIRSVIVSCSVGLTCDQFLKDYNELTGKPLPFKQFGYTTPLNFLASLPDVLRVNKSQVGSVLIPVENKLSSHINNLVSKQRIGETKKRSRCRRKGRSCNTSYHTERRKYYLEDVRDSSSDYDLSDDYDAWSTEAPDDNSRQFTNVSSKNDNESTRPSPISINKDIHLSNKFKDHKCEEEEQNSTNDINVNRLSNKAVLLKSKEKCVSRDDLDDVNRNKASKLYRKINDEVLQEKNANIVISKEHEAYLNGLVNGIVLDSSKILEPYQNLLRLTHQSKESSSIPAVKAESDLRDCIVTSDCESRDDHDNNSPCFENNVNFHKTSKLYHKISDKVGNISSIHANEINTSLTAEDDLRASSPVDDFENQNITRLEPNENIQKTNVQQSSTMNKSFIKNSPFSIGRGTAMKKILASQEAHKLQDKHTNFDCKRVSMGRGDFFKSMKLKYFNTS